jgi:zinc protease
MRSNALLLFVGLFSFFQAPSEAGQVASAPGPASSASPAAAPIDLEPLSIPHQKFVLDNGLTLLVHTDHAVPIVAVNVWYHVGSRNERPGRTGFAHLFEHFFFNGSENHPHGFREAMDDLGATNRNGTTSVDRTNFFEDVPVSALERTLYLEADRMGFLAGHISEAMLERERGVVQNEKRQGENQPYGRVFNHVVEAIYPASHPYSWPTIGSMDDLQAATLEDVREWYRTYYGPNNAVISLAGDITPERALELVKRYFDGIPPGPPLRKLAAWIPRLDRNVRDVMADRVPQARVYRLYHAPGWNDDRLQDLTLLAGVLSGSKSARLDRRLVYEKDLATSVSAEIWDKELGSNVLIVATLKPGVDVVEVEREIDAVIGELIASGPGAEELERARNRHVAAFARGLERLGGLSGRSGTLAESMTFGGDPNTYLRRFRRLVGATAAEVQATGKQWLDAPHYTMVVTPHPQVSAGRTAVDRSVLPALGAAPEVRFPPLQRAVLANGLNVILLERGSVPLVNMALVVDAGYGTDAGGKAGLASLALGLMTEGTPSRDTFRISDELDALGARITTASSVDLSVVRLAAVPMHLRRSLDIYADVIRNPSFPDGLFTLERERRLAQIAQEKATPVALAQRVVPRLLYGDRHAYGNPLSGTGDEAAVASLDRADLAAWHRAWFHPNNSTLVVTGAVTMATLMPELERVFGGWARGQAPPKRLTPPETVAGRRVYLIDRPDAPQSVILAAHVTEAGGQPEDLALEALMRNFGGISTSRLNRNLRLDKHWSYGTSGGVSGWRGPRPFMVIAPVQTDKTKEAMVEVAKEISGVAGGRPVTGEEFASVLRSETMRLPGRFETLNALESAAISIINFGCPDDYYASFARNVGALDEAALAAAGRRFVRPDELVWLVVGDLRLIEAGVRELNLGEIVRLDADGRPIQ